MVAIVNRMWYYLYNAELMIDNTVLRKISHDNQ